MNGFWKGGGFILGGTFVALILLTACDSQGGSTDSDPENNKHSS